MYSSIFKNKSIIALTLIAIMMLASPYRIFGATVTSFSDALSDSRASIAANHTISWDVVDTSCIEANDVFKLTLTDWITTGITEDDIDIQDDGVDKTTNTSCGSSDFSVTFNAGSKEIIFTACGTMTTITSGSVVTVKIGTNATQSGNGANQLSNPTAGSHTISLASTTGYTDSGEIQVATLSGQTTDLAVSASLSVTVAQVASAQSVNNATTSITTTATTVPFGTMTVNADKVGAHDVTVSTNAAEGYTTSIRWFGSGTTNGLTSGSNNCDGFSFGTATNASPQAWAAGTNPSGTAANADTCWYGYTTNDSTLGVGTADRFTSSGGNKWAPFDTTPYEVAYAPVNAEVTRIGHKVEVNALQPVGSYSGVTEYITTAVF